MAEDYFLPAPEEHISREKNKARQLRHSQWWKNRRASGHCHYCRVHFPPPELTMDHIVPISRGGYTVKSNVVPCCKECNNQKKYLLPLEWQAYLDQLDSQTE
ncbi:MAG: HNH endonuclease [Gemmatimonadetes bacterium]|nr:HNH endonuclease [Gemmatimonadota bacterium]